MTSYSYLENYLERVPASLLSEFTDQQLSTIQDIVVSAIPKPSPKLVDLRFTINLLVTRFYIVVFVGKDRRTSRRRYIPNGVARFGNVFMALILLAGANMVASFIIFMTLYFLKSWLGINIFKEMHLIDVVNQVLS
ncbi:hypothetical protein IQ266_26340 [filamentous cyanobacterium LEGE 11480]|uniref:Uncharacterized protein n=1 Tax=Romeriopsis navalis LEGE 11480 TaxID=2777977 RepID=A0A928Z721_9CYAN|nr:hypothetical protein [Romeriopsis navalis]MBE9033258.1 hypothetical protein [Romeriopsis navalis LEGE 11480]